MAPVDGGGERFHGGSPSSAGGHALAAMPVGPARSERG
ncbi:hypothetical protein I545_4040 [Mycobacterium kansasii 662]|uniref:Uncharacterized protein n=1 Tax=Mycobacterium kansasii 662 TaxID=1299326 RepID=X7ZB43_MYCKA|nr:hypothetical protein I545_4040 [Mycobacterium kansasii 662]